MNILLFCFALYALCVLLSCSDACANSLLAEIDLEERAPPPLEVLLQSIHSEGIDIRKGRQNINFAKNGNTIHGIGVSYEKEGGKSRETLIGLYKQAIIHSSDRAWYSLGQHYYSEGERRKAYNCFSHLAKLNTSLFLHFEERYSGWQYTYSVACKLWAENNPLCVSLLEKAYEFCPQRRKEAAHYLAKAYALKRSGFHYDREQAKHWLRISSDLGNEEDGYLLCELDYIDHPKNKTPLEPLIGRVRSLVDTSSIKAKYGAKPKIFLTRLLVEFGSTQGKNDSLQEAFYWLLKALEESDKRIEPLIWTTKDGTARSFGEIEMYRHSSMASAPDQSTRYINLYEIGFNYLEVSGAQETTLLKKAGESFLYSYELVPNLSSRFYATLIQYYLTIHNPNQPVCPSPLSSMLNSYQALMRDVLIKGDATLIRKLISNFPVSKVKGYAPLMALFYKTGLCTMSPSREHEIFFLKAAMEEQDVMAKRVLESQYPLAMPLNAKQREELVKSRTYREGKPKIAIIGGGLSGILTSILLAKLSKEGKISVGEICLIEQNSLLLKGASELPSRLHLGGEYPKDKTTAYQCLFGATLFRQMFQTEGVLTPIKANDFLLSRESIQSSQPDAYLSEGDFISHYELLNKAYANYLEQLKSKGSDEEVEKLLFGSLPLFYKIEGKEWEELGVDHHFALGLRTKERGLQAVGLGVILESLLDFYSVKVMYNCRVEDIHLLSEGGFVIKSGATSPLYARYLINAAWDNNSYLEWLIKRHTPSQASLVRQDPPRPVKHVFLRSLALIDITCSNLPKTSSFFGLVGRSGGMVSCFNKSFATIFIPQEGLSYQGQYDLSPAGAYPHALPYQAVDKRESLKDQAHQEKLAQEILQNAQHKYPSLKGSKALGVITHTTLSDNDEVHRRTHSHAYWVDNTDALQLCATKMTFAPFVACQAIARLVFDHEKEFLPAFNSQEKEYLSQFREGDAITDKKAVWNACLPHSFTLVDDDSFMGTPDFLEKMRLYAFHRHLPFTIFEESEEAKRTGRNFDKQFDLIAQNTTLKALDLGYHPLTLPIAHSLIEFLKNNKVLTIIKMGQLEEINDDDEDEIGGQILSELSKIPSLQEVTLKGWNLSFSKRYKPLAVLIERLQLIAFEEGTTLTALGIKYIFTKIPNPLPLRHFSFSDGNLTKQALEELFIFTTKLPNLQSLNMKGNTIGPRLKNDIKVLSTLLPTLPQLEKLDLSRRNQLFDSFQSEGDFPHDLPLSLEAHLFTLSMTDHPFLKEVDLTGNGSVSSSLQDRLEGMLRLKDTQ